MSRIALLADIHANLPALESVIGDARRRGAGRFVFLGDVVGYGASPAACVERVIELGGECVMGNHDVAIKGVRMRGRRGISTGWETDAFAAGLVHAAESLNPDQAAWLEQLPFTLDIPGGCVAHANLHDPEGFGYILDTAGAAPTLRKLIHRTDMTGFFGHTHIQAVFPDPYGGIQWLDSSRFHVPADMPCVVMVGSVGRPRHANDRRAAWVLWDPESRLAELCRTEYDRQRAVQDILDAGLPPSAAKSLMD